MDSNLSTELVDGSYSDHQYLDRGHQLSQMKEFENAESCFRKAIELNPKLSMAYNNLGWVLQMQGRNDEAIANFEKALELNPNLKIARRNLAKLLVILGRIQESSYLFYHEMLESAEGADWLAGLVTTAMAAPDLSLAGEYATLFAGLRLGSPFYSLTKNGVLPSQQVRAPKEFLTVSKLRHDINQFIYLQKKGILGAEFTSIIKDYQSVINWLTANNIKQRVPLNNEVQKVIGHVYNRIVHIRHSPRLENVFSDKWNATDVENQYLEWAPGIVVIDDFLSPQALESVRLFCLESTVWTGNRYAHGRLGAFFHHGFNCPLLLQIAEELRNMFPRVIGNRYPLRQLWGFKNGHYLPADSSTHADFAAVNVNFWITPEDANLNPNSGGLVVYGVNAPSNWDFATYNGRQDIIRSYLQQKQANSIYIPYRQNRAIIFNSDLFHGTAEVKFKEGYENRRINITMLYGDRENDIHHRHFSNKDEIDRSTNKAWKSAAFSRFR